MTRRADAAAATGERILDAAIDVFWQCPSERLSLDEVARRAGVARPTVLRRFGSKAGLLAAAVDRATERVDAQRGDVVAGDVPGAAAALVEHHERLGDRGHADAGRGDAELRPSGGRRPRARVPRRLVRARLRRGARRPGRRGARPAARQLIAVTDVHTWALLRRDRGLSRRGTGLALRELLESLTGGR
jgi:AcrR family transcriptional regulator